MPARGSSGIGSVPHSIATSFPSPSFTLFTRYVPASTGVHGRKATSQRGVMPRQIGGVFVVLASCRAAWGPSVFGFVAIGSALYLPCGALAMAPNDSARHLSRGFVVEALQLDELIVDLVHV